MNFAGAEHFAEILRQRPALIGLNLSANNIRAIGGRALGQSLPFSILRMLDLSLNKIPPESLKEILDTIKKPYQMRILNLWGNYFDSTCAKIVHRMLLSGVLKDECTDIRAIYEDGKYRVAEQTNLSYRHRQRYYLVSVPPIRPMDPYVERSRKLKVDITYASRLPRPEPCPSIENVVDEEEVLDFKEPSLISSDSSGGYTIIPKVASPCECRMVLENEEKQTLEEQKS